MATGIQLFQPQQQQVNPQDPVFEALGLMGMANQQAASEQEWMTAMAYEQQQASSYDCNMADPVQMAWCQAQAMLATAWQLEQMHQWQAQGSFLGADAGLAALTQANVDSSFLSLPPGLASAPAATTPRGSPTGTCDATPIKTLTLASEISTAPGSPSGDTDISEEDRPENVIQLRLKEELDLPPPPPPPMPTKLDLHAIIFEKAKDPASTHLLQLIKGNPEVEKHRQDQGKALLDLLRETEAAPMQHRNGPLASGSHRRAAAAARERAAVQAAEEEAATRRRRPRGGRGSRGASN